MPSTKKLAIKRSQLPKAGKGLFTNVSLKRGEKIVEYKGKVSSWNEANHLDGKNRYLFYIDKNNVIDARDNKKLLGRYANDAKGLGKKNGIKNNSTYEVEKKKVYIKAIKNIPAGSEILVNYGKEYWDAIKLEKPKKKRS